MNLLIDYLKYSGSRMKPETVTWGILSMVLYYVSGQSILSVVLMIIILAVLIVSEFKIMLEYSGVKA